MLDLTVPDGLWTIGGVCSPYVAGINQHHQHHRDAAADSRSLRSPATFARPWHGQFAPDSFHPNDLGYHHHADALLAALPAKATG